MGFSQPLSTVVLQTLN
jgi:hypothetical protein